MRLSQCYTQINSVTQAVSNSFCNEHGLQQPKLIEKCGYQECSPKLVWKIGLWSEVYYLVVFCVKPSFNRRLPDWQCDNCFSLHQGIQTRSVNCVLSNGTLVKHDAECQTLLGPKPTESQQCINLSCVAQWLPGKWSSVSKMSRQIFTANVINILRYSQLLHSAIPMDIVHDQYRACGRQRISPWAIRRNATNPTSR